MAPRIFREGLASRHRVLALTVRISIPQPNELRIRVARSHDTIRGRDDEMDMLVVAQGARPGVGGGRRCSQSSADVAGIVGEVLQGGRVRQLLNRFGGAPRIARVWHVHKETAGGGRMALAYLCC